MADAVQLPTEEEIAALPRWARVAFAARCARRVLPLFSRNFPRPSAALQAEVASAVELSELMSAHADPALCPRAIRAYTVLQDNPRGGPIAYAAAQAAYTAAATASMYPSAYQGCPDEPEARTKAARVITPEATRISCIAAVESARATASVDRLAVPNIVDDYSTLVGKNRISGWHDDTPIPPWVFGPLWPNGVPEGWPEGDPNERLVLHLTAPPDATPEQIEEMKAKLLVGVEKVSTAAGMTPEQFRHFVTIEVSQPVGASNV